MEEKVDNPGNEDVENQKTEDEVSKENGGKPSTEDQVNTDDLVEGWKEDRQRVSELEDENYKLKQQLRASKYKDDDDDDDLSMDERVDRRVKQREEDAAAEKELAEKKADREVSFMRRSNPFFRANEKEVLQRAIDRHMNLSEATKDLKDERERIAAAKENADDGRKKNAGGKSDSDSSKGGSTKSPTKYDPEKDKDKSIEDMYSEGL